MVAVAVLVVAVELAAVVVAVLVAADVALVAADVVAVAFLAAADYSAVAVLSHQLLLFHQVADVALLTRLFHLAFGFQTELLSRFLTR